jgi:hypothetical protein
MVVVSLNAGKFIAPIVRRAFALDKMIAIRPDAKT